MQGEKHTPIATGTDRRLTQSDEINGMSVRVRENPALHLRSHEPSESKRDRNRNRNRNRKQNKYKCAYCSQYRRASIVSQQTARRA
jgi:hypothetical protein